MDRHGIRVVIILASVCLVTPALRTSLPPNAQVHLELGLRPGADAAQKAVLALQEHGQALTAPGRRDETGDRLFALPQAPRHENGVALWLDRLERVLDAERGQETALASVLEADKPEEVREYEERLTRRREKAHVSRVV